jgi:hypothetical protein
MHFTDATVRQPVKVVVRKRETLGYVIPAIRVAYDVEE